MTAQRKPRGGAVTRQTNPDGSRKWYWSRMGRACSVWVEAGVTSMGSLPFFDSQEQAEAWGAAQ